MTNLRSDPEPRHLVREARREFTAALREGKLDPRLRPIEEVAFEAGWNACLIAMNGLMMQMVGAPG